MFIFLNFFRIQRFLRNSLHCNKQIWKPRKNQSKRKTLASDRPQGQHKWIRFRYCNDSYTTTFKPERFHSRFPRETTLTPGSRTVFFAVCRSHVFWTRSQNWRAVVFQVCNRQSVCTVFIRGLEEKIWERWMSLNLKKGLERCNFWEATLITWRCQVLKRGVEGKQWYPHKHRNPPPPYFHSLGKFSSSVPIGSLSVD